MKKVLAVLLCAVCIFAMVAVSASAATDPVISPEKVVKIVSGVRGDREGGTVTPPTNTYQPGEDVTFYIIPNDGYVIKEVWVNGEPIGAVKEYTFYNIQEEGTIYAEFEKEQEKPTKPDEKTTAQKPTKKNDKKTSPDTGAELGTIALCALGTVFVGSVAAVGIARKGRKEEY